MAKNKTTETSVSPYSFINSVSDETRRADCLTLVNLLKELTGLAPKMWGPSIVGFGSYHYRYESGREGDSPLISFSPRASSIALYFSGNFENRDAFLEKLGKFKSDKGCVHIKKLGDIRLDILKKMIANHIAHIQKLYPDK